MPVAGSSTYVRAQFLRCTGGHLGPISIVQDESNYREALTEAPDNEKGKPTARTTAPLKGWLFASTTLPESDAVVTAVDKELILKCTTDFPRLGAALLWAASRDEAMVVEHLVSIGRRSAIERTAHFFIELAERLSLIGLSSKGEFNCPLSQFVLADALGLTAIHINRVLRQLREQKMLTLRNGKVQMHDWNGLRKLAGFEGGYLSLQA